MQCYYHPETPAVGICKSCNRGICRDCAANVTRGIACRNSCEKDVEELSLLITQSAELGRSSGTMVKSVSILSNELFHIVLGLVFAGLALYNDKWLLLFIGAPFLLFGSFGLWRVWNARRGTRDDA